MSYLDTTKFLDSIIEYRIELKRQLVVFLIKLKEKKNLVSKNDRGISIGLFWILDEILRKVIPILFDEENYELLSYIFNIKANIKNYSNLVNLIETHNPLSIVYCLIIPSVLYVHYEWWKRT